ncbi:hypothetical protein [Paenibacillus sp. FSL W7-1287]|uniref:hypothetical protein n=1 Tax=Paenibacillus sp. FSL W7-1287 TaxID=2954538 RepID=UPI0030FA9AFF
MRSEDQIKSKVYELNQLIQNSQDPLQLATIKAQIEMLEWAIHNPTEPYHIEDLEQLDS